MGWGGGLQGCSLAHSKCLWNEWAANGHRPCCTQGPADDRSCSPDLPPRENSSSLPGLQREELPHLLPGLCQVGPTAAQAQGGDGPVTLTHPSYLSLPHACVPLRLLSATPHALQQTSAALPHTGPGLPGWFQLGDVPSLLCQTRRCCRLSKAVPLLSNGWSPKAWVVCCPAQTAGLLAGRLAPGRRRARLFAAAFAPCLPWVLYSTSECSTRPLSLVRSLPFLTPFISAPGLCRPGASLAPPAQPPVPLPTDLQRSQRR